MLLFIHKLTRKRFECGR